MASRSSKPQHPDYPRGCAVAYLRVSTHEQVESGAGLAAQRAAIAAYAERSGLRISRWCIDEGVSGGTAPDKRPALREALDALSSCVAGVLVVAKVDRLARSASDLLALRDRSGREGWSISSADGSIDLATPHGRAMATVMGAFAELERDLIRARTREALAEKRAAGVVLGRPRVLDDALVDRIIALRADGLSMRKVAALLDAEGVPTARGGGKWQVSSIQAVERSRAALAAIAAESASRG